MTNEQADRIKGLVERLHDASDRFLKWTYDAPYSGPPVISIPRKPDNIDAILVEAAEALQALQTRAEDAEQNLRNYENTDITAKVLEKQEGEIMSLEFLLALMAAAAPGPITDEWVSEAVEKSCRGEAVAPAELAAAYAYELGWRDGNREAASFAASLTPPLEQDR